MNEQIEKLAELSGFKQDMLNIGIWYSPEFQKFAERFAELIVEECAEQIIAKGTDWVDFAPSQTGVRPEYWDMAQQIKQHFGVEE